MIGRIVALLALASLMIAAVGCGSDGAEEGNFGGDVKQAPGGEAGGKGGGFNSMPQPSID